MAELNENLEWPVLTKTVHRELHKSGFYTRAAIKKPFLTQTNVAKCLEWCKRLKDWSLEQWKDVIFSDKSNFLAWKQQKEA